MSNPFHDKSIIITGASAGIGRRLAIELAKRGAHLTLAARGLDKLEKVAEECRALTGDAIAVATDVTDPEACKAMCEAAVDKFGGIDMLVNNAGITMWARFEDITDLSMFERIMRVNYLGAVYCTHFALAHIKKSNGLLVAISSLTGKAGIPTRTAYAGSKHAMQGFFDSLRVELIGSGVDVLVVSPGFVATEVRDQALGPDGKTLTESPRDENSATMSVEQCVDLIVNAMARRKREVIMTAKAKVGMWLKLIAPGVVDRIALKALREKSD